MMFGLFRVLSDSLIVFTMVATERRLAYFIEEQVNRGPSFLCFRHSVVVICEIQGVDGLEHALEDNTISS